MLVLGGEEWPAPPHVLAAQFRLNAGGAHPLGERLLDVNHAMHVSLPPVDGGPGREWWLICGFYDPNVGREQSIRHAVVINASTLRPRLGPAMPTGSGACSALPIHADGYAKPALPCGWGFDCCWPEQGRVNNFFLKRERGSGQANPMLNVRILPESILDARVGSRTNASRMLVVHNAGCTKGGRSAESCAAALYASATQLGLERVSAFGF